MTSFKRITEYIVVLGFLSVLVLSIFITKTESSEILNLCIHLVITGILFLSLIFIIYSREQEFRFGIVDIIFAIVIISQVINLLYSKIPYVSQGHLFYWIDFFIVFLFCRYWFKNVSDFIGFVFITSGAVLSILFHRFPPFQDLMEQSFILVVAALPLAISYSFFIIMRGDLTINDQNRYFYTFLRIIILLTIPLAIYFDKQINVVGSQGVRNIFYSREYALDIFKGNMILGSGLGTFNFTYSPFQKHFLDFQPTLNNIFYSVISEQGLVGICLNSFLFISLLFMIIRKYKKIRIQRERIKFVGFTSSLIVIAYFYFFTKNAGLIFYGFLFWGLLAVILSLQVGKSYYRSLAKVSKTVLTILTIIFFILCSFILSSSFLSVQMMKCSSAIYRTFNTPPTPPRLKMSGTGLKRGIMSDESDRYSKKIERAFPKLIMIDSFNYHLYIILGDYYKGNFEQVPGDKGMIVKVEKAYKNALKLNEYAGDVYEKLANFYQGVEEINKADEILKRGLDRFPTNLEILKVLGMSYEKKEEYSEALKYYLRLQELEPQKINWYINLARVYKKLSDVKNEKEMYYKILQIDSKNRFAMDALKQ